MIDLGLFLKSQIQASFASSLQWGDLQLTEDLAEMWITERAMGWFF